MPKAGSDNPTRNLIGEELAAIGIENIDGLMPSKSIVVQNGDTLWNLAERHLGTGQRWRELYFMNLRTLSATHDANKGVVGPNWIFPGTEIRVPAF